MTLACEDANSKLTEVVTVADVDAEKRVDNSLVQILKLKFGHKTKFLFKLEIIFPRNWPKKRVFFSEIGS